MRIAHEMRHKAQRDISLLPSSVSELCGIIDKRSQDVLLVEPSLFSISARLRRLVCSWVDVVVVTRPRDAPFRRIWPRGESSEVTVGMGSTSAGEVGRVAGEGGQDGTEVATDRRVKEGLSDGSDNGMAGCSPRCYLQ